MEEPFEIEWLGGAAEHHFRSARPAVESLPWGTLNAADFSPDAVERARGSWTEVAINEYRAVASFSEVLRALVAVRAPLDLLGMTSDFLADECAHVELASRLCMELGGAAPRLVDLERFTPKPVGATALERANELVLTVSCIAEAFSGGTASVNYAGTSHPLPRAVYETILRDEARHRRLGGLYFEWVYSRLDDRELHRLGRVMLKCLRGLAPFWKGPAAKPNADSAFPHEQLQALGWLAPPRLAPVAREVVERDVLDPLATLGITITPEERADLLA